MTELSALNIKITGDAGDLKAAVAAANGDLAKLVAGAEAAGLKISGLGNKFTKVGGAATSSGLAMRGVAQQLSQVGQQTMATGNFVQALAIQLPDIGIGFGALGGAIGLVAGIALPMLINAFGGASDKAKEMQDQIQAAGDAVAAYSNAAKLAITPINEMIAKYGELAGAVREANIQVSELARGDAMRALDALLSSSGFNVDGGAGLDAIAAVSQDFRAPSEEMIKLADAAVDVQFQISEIARTYKLTADQALNLAVASDRVRDSAGKSADEQVAATSALRDYLIEIYGSADAANEATNGLVEALNAAAIGAANLASIDMAGPIGAAAGAAARLADNLAAASSARDKLGQMAVEFSPGGQALMAYGSRGGNAAQGAIADRNAPAADLGGVGGGSPMFAELESVQSSLMSQEALQLESYTRQQEQLALFLEQKLITQQEYAAMSEASQQQHSDAMSAIDVYRYGDGLQKAGAFFGDMASALAGGNEKMLKISKAFGAAEALINAWRAYAQALATPGMNPLQKFALAAKVLAAGMGAVNAIKGGGGGGGKSSAAGGAGAGAVSPTQTLNFTVTNDPFGFGERIVRQIATQLNESRRNGSNIIASVR